METLTTLKTRRSCRAYKANHVEEEKLNAIIEAGTYAPTGLGNELLMVFEKEAFIRGFKLGARMAVEVLSD